MPPTLAHRHARIAIFLILIAYACFSWADALMKWLAQSHHLGTILFSNGAFIVVFSLIALAFMGKIPALWQGPHTRLHLFRACFFAVLSYLSAFSVQHIPLSDFYGIVFLSPFLISLYAYLFLKEEVGLPRVLAMIAGFVGVLILAGPKLDHLNIGYVTTFALLFILVGHIMLIRRIGNSDPWPLYSFFPGIGLMACGLWDGRAFTLPPLASADTGLFILEAAGVFGGPLFLARAPAVTPVTPIPAPSLDTAKPWGILYGFVLFHVAPAPETLIGGAVIIASGLWGLWYEQSRKGPFHKG